MLYLTLTFFLFDCIKAESAIPLSFRRSSSNFALQPPILDTAQLILKFDEVIAETEQFAKIPYGKYNLNVSSAGVYSGASSPGGNPMIQNSPRFPESKRGELKGREWQPGDSQDILPDGYPHHQSPATRDARTAAQVNLTDGKSEGQIIVDDSTSERDSSSDSECEEEEKVDESVSAFGARDKPGVQRGRSRSKEDIRSEEITPSFDDQQQSEVERQIQDIMRLENEVEIHAAEREVEPIAEEDEFVSELQSDIAAAAERDLAFAEVGESLQAKSEARTARGANANDSNLLRGRSRLGQVS